MKGFLTGAAVFLLFGALSVVFIIPGVFNFFQGLFETSDVGTIVGIVAAFIVGAICLQVSLVSGIFVGAFVNASD